MAQALRTARRVRTFRTRPVVTAVPLGSKRLWTWAISIATSGVVASAALAQQEFPEPPLAAQVAPIVQTPASRPVAPTVTPVTQTSSAPPPPQQLHAFISITAPADGTIDVVFVRIGDRVEAGQPLLTFNDKQTTSQLAQLRLDVASARARAAELEASLKELDAAIAGATAQLPTPVAAVAPPEAAAVVARAQSVYNEAVAREQRAAALIAHGVAAAQELEQAQVGVRTAAEALAFARREGEAMAAAAAAQALDARSQAQAAIETQQSRRAQLAAQLDAIRQAQREAEAALAGATADTAHLVVRAPAPSVVTELAVQAGDRTIAGSPLVKLDRIPPP